MQLKQPPFLPDTLNFQEKRDLTEKTQEQKENSKYY